jgi:hypothetical protein
MIDVAESLTIVNGEHMRILLFPRLQQDIDKFWVTAWREMCSTLRSKGHSVKIAIAGAPLMRP